jgi:hypothetical protein
MVLFALRAQGLFKRLDRAIKIAPKKTIWSRQFFQSIKDPWTILKVEFRRKSRLSDTNQRSAQGPSGGRTSRYVPRYLKASLPTARDRFSLTMM